MILAAGFGARLLPATNFLPKPCFRVLNVPIIVHIINSLKSAGVTDIVINLHHLGDAIEQVIHESDISGVKIHFSYEPKILGTAGGIKKAQDILGDDTFILHNGDIFSSIDLSDAVRFHKTKGAQATMVVKKGHHSAFIGLDSDGSVARFPYGRLSKNDGYKTMTYFTGIHILEPEIFDYIPDGVFYGINARAYPEMIADGHNIFGYMTDALWHDIGTPEDFLNVNFELLDQLYSSPGATTPYMTGGRSTGADDAHAPVLIGENVTIMDGCEIGPYAIIGNGCVIHEGCRVTNCVIFDGVELKESSDVSNSIVLDGCTLRVRGAKL